MGKPSIVLAVQIGRGLDSPRAPAILTQPIDRPILEYLKDLSEERAPKPVGFRSPWQRWRTGGIGVGLFFESQ
jgi:hypothetical protein